VWFPGSVRKIAQIDHVQGAFVLMNAHPALHLLGRDVLLVHEKPHFVVEDVTVLDYCEVLDFVRNDASRAGVDRQGEKGAFVQKLLDVLSKQLVVQIEVRGVDLNSRGTANHQVRLSPFDQSVVRGDLVGTQRVRVRTAHTRALSSQCGTLYRNLFESGNLVTMSIFKPVLVHEGVDDFSKRSRSHVDVVHGLGVQMQLVRALQCDHVRAISVDEGPRGVQRRATGLFGSKLSCSRVNSVEVRPRGGCR
jgi:hypothetical protein